MQKIIHGDCLEIMRTFPDNHFSAIVTDPPYGISFMGKGWDRGIPPIEYWQEMLRILKPGGHLLAAGLPRMMHRLICVIEDAGFEIRDLIMHLFGQGFPKSHNFGKKINEDWHGYGTALKPAWEGWSLAMKPLYGTFAQNAEQWGVAGINIKSSRVGIDQIKTCAKEKGSSFTSLGKAEGFNGCSESFHKGRWPANLILDEEAAQQLDEMTGILKTGGGDKGNKTQDGGYGKGFGYIPQPSISNSGGASRFFYCAKASSSERNVGLEGMPLKEYDDWPQGLIPNAPSKCRPRENNHPTVKPIALMEYLIKLIMPPSNGLLLDPFAGSGSTLVAAKRLGVAAIGIEKEREYCDIAEARISNMPISPEQYEFAM